MIETSPKSVLFVLNTLDGGGMERMTLTLAEELRRRGRYRPVIACLSHAGELAGRARGGGIAVHERLLHHKYDAAAIIRLRRLFADERVAAAVIVDQGGDRMFWTCLARGKRRAGRPAIVMAARTMPGLGRRRIERLNRLLIGRLNAITALGPRQAEALVSVEGLPADRIHIVPTGLSPAWLAAAGDARSARDDFRRRLGVPPEAVVVLCIANPRPIKRIDLFCRCAAELLTRDGPSVRFWLVGDGPGRAEVRRWMDEFNLRDEPRFRWLGQREDADRLWPAADIGVCCSDSEAVSGAMLEALSCGVAFVSTAVGDHPTILGEDERFGLLTPPGDAAALAGAVGRLVDDPGLRRRLAEAARAEFAVGHTTKETADAFEKVLASAVGTRD